MTQNRLTLGEVDKLGQVAVEDVRVAAEGVVAGVLPDSLMSPAAGDGAGLGVSAGQHEGGLLGEVLRVAGALLPPANAGVDERVPLSLGVVLVDEFVDPLHHLGRVLRVAGARAVRVLLQVDHPRQGLAVVLPPATVGQEVLGLLSTGADVRAGEVVGAVDKALTASARCLL